MAPLLQNILQVTKGAAEVAGSAALAMLPGDSQYIRYYNALQRYSRNITVGYDTQLQLLRLQKIINADKLQPYGRLFSKLTLWAKKKASHVQEMEILPAHGWPAGSGFCNVSVRG